MKTASFTSSVYAITGEKVLVEVTTLFTVLLISFSASVGLDYMKDIHSELGSIISTLQFLHKNVENDEDAIGNLDYPRQILIGAYPLVLMQHINSGIFWNWRLSMDH